MLAALAGAPTNDAMAAYHLATLYAGRGQWTDAEHWIQVSSSVHRCDRKRTTCMGCCSERLANRRQPFSPAPMDLC